MRLTKDFIDLYGRRYFKILTEEYRELRYQYLFKIISSTLNKYLTKKDTMLDIGCGIGWLLKVAEKTGCEIYGADFATTGVKTTKANVKSANLVVADAHHLPFKKESFSVISCTWVLEHVEKPNKVLEEIFRILKTDGVVMVEAPSGELVHTIHKSPKVKPQKKGGDAHFWEYSPRDLQYLLKNHKFAIVERRGLYRFGFNNLFIFPTVKLIRSVARRTRSKGKTLKSNEERLLEKDTITKAVKKVINLFFNALPFSFFLSLEMILANKPPFNFFGIGTLIVGQKIAN